MADTKRNTWMAKIKRTLTCLLPVSSRRRGHCINCGACEPECPNSAITEGDDIYVIDPDLCTECVGFYDQEACQAVCPVECCLPDPERRESEAVLLERALRLHPNDEELKRRAAANDFPSRFRKPQEG